MNVAAILDFVALFLSHADFGKVLHCLQLHAFAFALLWARYCAVCMFYEIHLFAVVVASRSALNLEEYGYVVCSD